MPSQHPSLTPARSSVPARRALRELTVQPGFRIKLKPRRDALTRVRHDLRSLLQAVVGYTDLLAEPRYGVLTSEQARFVSNVREAAAHLEELVDTCIELSRPDNDNTRTLESPQVQLGQSLRRVRNTLAQQLCCDLVIAGDLETRSLTLDVTVLERALMVLAGVLTREGAVALQLGAALVEGRLCLTLQANDAPDPRELTSVEALEDQLGNRDFVRLKLSEVLLSRLGFTTRLSTNVDVATLTL
jgi:signal transduction histidine kinase